MLTALFAALQLAIGCPDSVSDWLTGRGELLADRRCDSFLLTTDASDHEESLGEVSWKREVRLPYEAQVRWRRLGPDGSGTIWLKILGALLLFRSGGVGLWMNRTQFASTGFVPLPGFLAHLEHEVTVTQSKEAIEVRIDGAHAARFVLRGAPDSGRLAVGFSGARGYRSLLSFRGFSVREGGTHQAARSASRSKR